MGPTLSGNLIYLDHHATTPLLPSVLEAINPWLEYGFGNPSNILHHYGRDARNAVSRAREQVAELIGANPEEIFFTSGATESNNLAIRGVLKARVNNSLAISNLEHASVAEPAQKGDYSLHVVQSDEVGMVQLDILESILEGNSITLVSIIFVQGEIGTINPIREITEIAHRYGALVHTDAAQAVGKIEVDVNYLDVDYLTIAGHKMYGPKGVGALFKREDAPLEPIVYGAGHEQGLRSGTENVPYLVGFGEACRIATEDLLVEKERQEELRDRLRNLLIEHIPVIRINGHPRRHPGNLHFSLPNINSVDVLAKLPDYALSVGSACHSKSPKDNPLIQALKMPEEYSQGSFRVGIGRANTMEQIQNFADDFIHAYNQTKTYS